MERKEDLEFDWIGGNWGRSGLRGKEMRAGIRGDERGVQDEKREIAIGISVSGKKN